MRRRSLVSFLVVLACGGKLPAPAPAPVVQAPAPPAASPTISRRGASRSPLCSTSSGRTSSRHHPEIASILGDHRYDDRWTDHSPEAIAAEHAKQKEYLARFDAIDTTGFPEQEALNKELMVRDPPAGRRRGEVRGRG